MIYKDYTVRFDKAELPKLYNEWLWLISVDDLKRPLVMNAFGDLFFQKKSGEVFFLDTLEGTANYFAESHEAMERELSEFESRNKYLFCDLVNTLREKGISLGDNQLYLFKLHPLIGGQATSQNVEIASMRLAISLTGQLHRQVKRKS